MRTFGQRLRNKNYKAREGVYAVIFDRKKIALVLTPKGYFLPGGRIEENEETEDALRREVIEELGWEIRLVKYIGEAKEFFFTKSEDTYFESTARFFIAEKSGIVGDKLEKDHELQWMTPEDARTKLLHPYHAWAVQKSLQNG